MLGNTFGLPHLIIILAIILLLFGAPKLPGLARSISQSMKIFRTELKSDDKAVSDSASTGSAATDNASTGNASTGGAVTGNAAEGQQAAQAEPASNPPKTER